MASLVYIPGLLFFLAAPSHSLLLLLPPAHVSTRTPQQWGERSQAPGHIYHDYVVQLYWLVMERRSKALQGRGRGNLDMQEIEEDI